MAVQCGKGQKVMGGEAWQITIYGLVQGVGFRPFVYRLAVKYQLNGWVYNSSSGLTIWVEGRTKQLADFVGELLGSPPKLANITDYKVEFQQKAGYQTFEICSSAENDRESTLISPDIAVCPACLQEFFDACDRRFYYPMINCTDCGPRFSITKALPYDRNNTSMHTFPMCTQCRAEYTNINSRRFHAQPVACPVCGPRVWLVDKYEKEYQGYGKEFLKQGQILAIKGIGGFHLACDATNAESVAKLRTRKRRDAKPLAIMFSNVEEAKKYCIVSEEEANLLASRQRPIVLLEKRPNIASLPDALAPGMHSLGVILPYTACHYLLFDEELKALVMTSANLSDEPLITDNDAAVENLADIADFFLLHNRPIVNSCDDSVAVIVKSRTMLYRRARGYVPLPVKIRNGSQKILSCGGDLKNTICLAEGSQAFVSQHLGDLSHYGNYLRYSDTIRNFQQLTGIHPAIIAYDLHPGYISSQYAKKQKAAYHVGIQHHHAHFASCLADNQAEGPTLGVICDGTGYGLDGNIWGFEILYGDYGQFVRLAHLEYLPIPGGDATVADSMHTAFAYLYRYFGKYAYELARQYLRMERVEGEIIRQQIDAGINTYDSSSCGRLFDAVSALLGICTKVSYEGQAAMLLEACSIRLDDEKYEYTISSSKYPWQLSVAPMFEQILSDLKRRLPISHISGKFHNTVASIIVDAVCRLGREKQCKQVALSGGTFQNKLLLTNVIEKLKDQGLIVYIHQQVPSNDGGLSLGQAVIANEVVKGVYCSNGQSM